MNTKTTVALIKTQLQRCESVFKRKQNPDSQKREERRVWRTQREFILSSIGFIVGFGNTWRFPSKVAKHSGAFIIAYVIVSIFITIPGSFLQLSIGQYSGWPAHIAFGKMAPLLSGIGWALVFAIVPQIIYYNMISAWSFNFLIDSVFHSDHLPWMTCNNSWNDIDNVTCTDAPPRNDSTHNISSAAEQYLYNAVLNRSANITNWDPSVDDIQWKMVGFLFIVWAVTFLCVSKGIESFGKVVYFTATFPFAGLLILLIRGLTLRGGWDGVCQYFHVDHEKLFLPQMWYDAAVQAFYSMSLDGACHVTLASYSRVHNNIYRDSLLLVAVDTFTSILSGVVMFAFIGHSAYKLGLDDLSPLVNKDEPLFISFIAFPDAIARVAMSQLWAFIYFTTICMAAIDCEFGWIEQLAGSTWGYVRGHMGLVKTREVAVICVTFFLLGLPFCTRGGIYIWSLFDTFSPSQNSLLLLILQFVIVGWIYGVDNFFTDIHSMLRPLASESLRKKNSHGVLATIVSVFGPTGSLMSFCFKLLSPASLLLLLVIGFTSAGLPKPYLADDHDCEHSDLALAFGWLMSMLPLLFIPYRAIKLLLRAHRKGQPLLSTLSSAKWQKLKELTSAEVSDDQNPDAGGARVNEVRSGASGNLPAVAVVSYGENDDQMPRSEGQSESRQSDTGNWTELLDPESGIASFNQRSSARSSTSNYNSASVAPPGGSNGTTVVQRRPWAHVINGQGHATLSARNKQAKLLHRSISLGS